MRLKAMNVSAGALRKIHVLTVVAFGKGAAPKGSLEMLDKSVFDMTRSSRLFTFTIPKIYSPI